MIRERLNDAIGELNFNETLNIEIDKVEEAVIKGIANVMT
jgi:hypothetical protein